MRSGPVPAASTAGERVQKVLARLGLGSRREAENWIRAGRVSINGQPAALGARLAGGDQLKLDGRLVRLRAGVRESVLLCHRSPGLPLLKPEGDQSPLIASLPVAVGRRFVSVSPLPRIDGGLELVSSDGALALRLQRAVRGLEVEFSVRVRGELDSATQQRLRQGELDSGERLDIRDLTAEGGEGANRWYRIVTGGASGNQLRQLLARQGVTASRILRTRIGTLALERSLARGRTRPLTEQELESLLQTPIDPPIAPASPPRRPRKPVQSRRGSPARAATGRR